MYRDDLAALAARKAALEAEVAGRTRELEQTTQMLDELRTERRLPVLANIRVASPCTADWAKMAGDDRVRHCGDCKKNVYNLSSMTRTQAEALIFEKEGRLCARYFRRADGTILFGDCWLSRQYKRRRRLVAVGAAALLGGGGLVHAAARAVEDAQGSQWSTACDLRDETAIQGDISPDGLVPEEGVDSSDGSGAGDASGSTSFPITVLRQPMSGDGLDRAIIKRYVKHNVRKIAHCYEKELLERPYLEGAVSVRFSISLTGSVQRSVGDGFDITVASCVADVISTIDFPRPTDGGVQVSYPFYFGARSR